jgi:Fe-S-cluster containining protein
MAESDGQKGIATKRSNVQIIPPPPARKPKQEDPESDEPDEPEDDGESAKSVCAGCAGWCCSLVPELTVYDVVRIAESVGRSVDEFVAFVESTPDNSIPFRVLGKTAMMTFKRNGSVCVFFDSKSHLKCSINASKPSVCTTYPFSLHSSGMLGRVMCPAENMRRMQQALDTKTRQDAAWEFGRHTEIVEDWNARAEGDEGISEFLAFAAKEMESEKTPLGSILRKIRRSLRSR